jgi:hypothetical protein
LPTLQAPSGSTSSPANAPSSQETSQEENKEPQKNSANSESITERQLAWVKRQLQHDETRIRNVCTHYHVGQLEQLTQTQARNLINRLLAQAPNSKNSKRATQKQKGS